MNIFVAIIILLLSHYFALLNGLKVCQYNVEWMFLSQYSPAGCYGSGCTWHNITSVQKHLAVTQTLLYEAEPDIINFCEILGMTELSALSAPGMMPYFVIGTDSATGQNVGLAINRNLTLIGSTERINEREVYPVIGTHCDSNVSGTEGISKNIVQRMKWNGMNVTVIGVHLLAHPDDMDRCVMREAQAQILHKFIEVELKNGNEVILMGDMNDFDGVVLDRESNRPISRVLDILRGYSVECDVYSYLMYSAGAFLRQVDRYSEYWDKNGDCVIDYDGGEVSMIDHILMSAGLYKRVIGVEMMRRSKTVCGTYFSDHDGLCVIIE